MAERIKELPKSRADSNSRFELVGILQWLLVSFPSARNALGDGAWLCLDKLIFLLPDIVGHLRRGDNGNLAKTHHLSVLLPGALEY